LLYPEEDLIEICDAAYRLSNIVLVRIITNGTVVPSDTYIQKLKKSLTHMNISDYGELAKNEEMLENALYRNNMIFDVAEMSDHWYQLSPPTVKQHPVEKLQSIFDACSIEKDILHNGVLHFCEYSAVLYEKQMEVLESSEIVDFTDEHNTVEMFRQQITDYKNRKKYLSACAYCQIDCDKHVKPAEQLNEVYTRSL
jgi:hypothetical protein